MQTLISVGIMGGMALYALQLQKQMTTTQVFVQASQDELDLANSIRRILDDPNSCRVSLLGEGQYGSPLSSVIVNKSAVDEIGEGIDLELGFSNQGGDQLQQKKFSAIDPDYQKFGKLTIKSIRLVLNNGTGFDYQETFLHEDMAEVVVTYDKKIAVDNSREITKRFPVHVQMTTSVLRQSELFACSTETITTEPPGFEIIDEEIDDDVVIDPGDIGGNLDGCPRSNWRFFKFRGRRKILCRLRQQLIKWRERRENGEQPKSWGDHFRDREKDEQEYRRWKEFRNRERDQEDLDQQNYGAGSS